MASKQEYPKWMYGPAGKDGKPQSRIFGKDDQVPKGWTDNPKTAAKKAKEPVRTAEGEPTPEEKEATIAELRAAGAEISDDASVEEINAAIDKLTK